MGGRVRAQTLIPQLSALKTNPNLSRALASIRHIRQISRGPRNLRSDVHSMVSGPETGR